MEKKVDIRKTKEDKFKLEKQILENVNSDIFTNLIIAILMMIYFVFINLAFTNIEISVLKKDLEVFCLVFLVLGIFVIERAYKKDSGKVAIYGIETLIFSFHTLTINHFVTIYNLDFQVYVLTSSYIFSIYYVLKSIIIYTIAKRKYLTNLSDISEIVKDEPTKKEASKKPKKEEKIEKDTKPKTSEKKTTRTKKVKNDKEDKEDKPEKVEKAKKTVKSKKEKSEEKVEEKEEKKTTKRKTTKKEVVAEEINKTENNEESTEETKPKRRGRPPKKKVEVND